MVNKPVKRVVSLLMAFAFLCCFSLSSFAVDSASEQPPEIPSGEGGGAGGAGGSGGGTSAPSSYTSVRGITEDTTITGETVASTGSDENAIFVSGGTATLSNLTITRISDDSTGGELASFYGVGAAVLAGGGTTLLNNSSIQTEGDGGAGVFAYSDGVAYVANTTITTTGGSAGGLHVAGGGTLYAWNNTVTTEGESSAAIRSDRGSGTMVVNGGTYTSNGTGSPALYSTAAIAVANATLTATQSEGVCIEGQNSVALFDVDLSSAMPDSSQNDCTWSVILYQSTSGDSEEGTSTFEMNGGSLTSSNGGLFYTTNTASEFLLQNVDITAASNAEFFLRCTGNANERGWGTTGSNGADCNFTAIQQTMIGNVIYDSVSNLDFYMQEGSTLTGAFLDDESCAGDGGNGTANLTISSDSTWAVTEDSTLTALASEGKIVDADGKTVTIQDTDGTVYVQGDSSLTVTVAEYSTTADFSGALTPTSWSDYEVAAPDGFDVSATDTTDTADEEDLSEQIDENSAIMVIALTCVAGALVIVFGIFLKKYQDKHKAEKWD